ncbi:helix-turn-helix transcriptional regulator [Variovorax sp. KBS0712]|uniref:helix-turn-helix transcriptional regulator n=1 Tax=Variovorax sp. KBS0712 TaxID=2578111 RepID=UPI00111B1067|nr:LuxR C-terminal-related transcriptional regulator [Variovorax sp. KBS0712]TSD56408.1 helix-turn-helix transcriptional regulator [Variovorax sp. KBS0712]
MNRNLALQRTLDAVAHLSDREPPWTALLQGMQQLIGGDSATLILIDGSGELLNFQQHDVSPATERVYTEHFFAHDIVAPLTIGAPPGSWFDTQELFSSSLLSREAFYIDFMCQLRMRQLLTFIIEDSPQRRGGLTVQRNMPTSHARRDLESTTVRRATSALRRGMAQRDAMARQWFDTAESAFDGFGEAICLVTPRGTALRASARAQELFSQGRALRLRGGRLWHPSVEVQRALQSALEHAPQAREPVRLSIPDERAGQCRLELVPAVPQLSLGKEALVFIRIHHDDTRSLPPIDSLCSSFGITPAEARVLTALMAGQSPKQHAVLQGVSVHTVRSQVTSLMTKMECTRQVDLVRKGLLAP